MATNVLPAGDRPRQDKAPVPWHKEDTTLTDDEFDENAFLRGGYTNIRKSVDRELPPRQGEVIISTPSSSHSFQFWGAGGY